MRGSEPAAGAVRARNLVASLCAVALLGAALVVWRAPEAAAWLWRFRAGAPAMASFEPKLAPPLRWLDDYYVVGDLGQGAYAIGEPRYGQCNFSYLIVGARSALLFDTGPGVRNIEPVVRRLLPASMPIEVLPSHLHFDHTGNLHRFDHVVLPDLPALHGQVHDGVFHLGFYQNLAFEEGFRRPRFAVARWLAPGSAIDLGGRRLTLLSVPGHTPDSVVLFDRDADRLFAGDFIYPSDIYAFLPGADLTAYAASARRVRDLIGAGTRVLGAHGCDRPPLVDVPTLSRKDVSDLEIALARAASSNVRLGAGWYPRMLPVNERMTLLATYPWMAR